MFNQKNPVDGIVRSLKRNWKKKLFTDILTFSRFLTPYWLEKKLKNLSIN